MTLSNLATVCGEEEPVIFHLPALYVVTHEIEADRCIEHVLQLVYKVARRPFAPDGAIVDHPVSQCHRQRANPRLKLRAGQVADRRKPFTFRYVVPPCCGWPEPKEVFVVPADAVPPFTAWIPSHLRPTSMPTQLFLNRLRRVWVMRETRKKAGHPVSLSVVLEHHPISIRAVYTAELVCYEIPGLAAELDRAKSDDFTALQIVIDQSAVTLMDSIKPPKERLMDKR